MADDNDNAGLPNDDALQAAGPIFGAPNVAHDEPKSQKPTSPKVENEYSRQRFDEAAAVFGSDAFTIKRIDELRANGMPAALFLGVRETGKTWLLQRMKSVLEANFVPRPRIEFSDEALTSDQVQAKEAEQYENEFATSARSASNDSAATPSKLTPQEVLAQEERKEANQSARSGAIVVHRFYANPGSFAMIDVPGEMIERLADERYSELRALMAALEYASVIIVALPADSVFLGRDIVQHGSLKKTEAFREHFERISNDSRKIGKFSDGLIFLASVRSLIRKKNIKPCWKDASDPPDQYDREITPDNVEAFINSPDFEPVGGHDGMQCPTYFALTKADKIFAIAGSVPDNAREDKELLGKFEAANRHLRESDEGQFLQRLYNESPAVKKSLLDRNDIWLKMRRLLVGASKVSPPLSCPPELMQQLQKPLFNRLTRAFPMSRFDLVSAFYGHPYNTLKEEDFYRLPSSGVEKIIEWLATAHDNGLTGDHVWARSVFTWIYGEKLRTGSPFGGMEKHANARRLRFFSPRVLASMFKKEWHPLQFILPYAIPLAAAALMCLATFDPFEKTWQVPGDGYGKLQVTIAAVFSSPPVYDNTVPEALGSLKSVYTSADAKPASGLFKVRPQSTEKGLGQKAECTVVRGLQSWSPVDDDFRLVPTRQSVPQCAQPEDILERERQWLNSHACDLNGWNTYYRVKGGLETIDYRDIVRRAAINGYGNCGLADRLIMRVPWIDGLRAKWGSGGLWAGLISLALGWLVVLVGAVYARWFSRTRKAYAWLYHSGVATMERARKKSGSS